MIPETVYVLCLDKIQKGFIYYRTISEWVGFSEKYNRDQREASTVIFDSFKRCMNRLNLYPKLMCEDKDLIDLRLNEWVLIPDDYAKSQFGLFLSPAFCTKAPIGLYIDINVPGKRKGNRTTPFREDVLIRDGRKCLLCNKSEEDGIKLTMQHVIPLSKGGETTAENLVTLCERCNQNCKDEEHLSLFELAGLKYLFDDSLLAACKLITSKEKEEALKLSHNIMLSRCRVDKIDELLREKIQNLELE